MMGSISHRCPKGRSRYFVQPEPHGNKIVYSVGNESLADGREQDRFGNLFAATHDDCFEQLSGIGKVPIQRPQ